MEKHEIRLVVLGLEQRSLQVLANALHKHSNGLCNLDTAEKAHVALFDLNSNNIDTLINDFRNKFPATPLIGLGKPDSGLPMHKHIPNPVNIPLLLAAIVELSNSKPNQVKNMISEDKIAQAMKALENKNIAKSLHKRAEEIQPKTAAKRAMPGKNDEMCFDPDRFLLGTILRAQNQASNNAQTAVLTCWSDRTIVIDPAQERISSDLTDNQIRTLAIAPIDDNLSSPIHVKFYKSGEANSELDAHLTAKDLRHYSQEIFLWNLGLLTCRGRIPAEFTVCNRHYLRRWPNLTRMHVPANAMRILAFWSQQPCSLTDIKEQLDIPLQDIFAIFSAAYAAGLTGEARRKSDQILEVIELKDHKKRGLMKSIISRLRGSKTENFPKTA